MESDHKPLESIHLKHLHSAPARLQRMLLRLQPYDIVIRYRPGPDVSVADALSRLPSEVAACLPDMDVQIHDIHDGLSAVHWRHHHPPEDSHSTRRGADCLA